MSKLQLKPTIKSYMFTTVKNRLTQEIDPAMMDFHATINDIPVHIITYRTYLTREELKKENKEINFLEFLEDTEKERRPFIIKHVEGIDLATLKTVADIDFRELLQIHKDKYYEYKSEILRKEKEERAKLYDASSVHEFKKIIGFGEVSNKDAFVNDYSGSTVRWVYELNYKGKREDFVVTDEDIRKPGNVRVKDSKNVWARGREMRIEKAVANITEQIQDFKDKIDRIKATEDWNNSTYELLVATFPNAVVEKVEFSKFDDFKIYIKEKDEEFSEKKGIEIRRYGDGDNDYFIVTRLIGKLSLDGVKTLFETVTNISKFSY